MNNGGIVYNYDGATVRLIIMLRSSAGGKSGHAQGGSYKTKGVYEYLDNYYYYLFFIHVFKSVSMFR